MFCIASFRLLLMHPAVQAITCPASADGKQQSTMIATMNYIMTLPCYLPEITSVKRVLDVTL